MKNLISNSKRWTKRVLIAISGLILFFYGVGVYHWPPFAQVQFIKSQITGVISGESTFEYQQYLGKKILLQNAFTDPVNEVDLYYPKINSMDGIRGDTTE